MDETTTDKETPVKKKYKHRRIPPHPQEVWLTAWCSAAIGTACKTPEVASQWADHAFNAYLKRWSWTNSDGVIKELEVEPVDLPKKK